VSADLDLTEAIEAAAKARHRWANGQTGETIKWSEKQPKSRLWDLDAEQAALRAAAPIIERQVRADEREKVAARIDDYRLEHWITDYPMLRAGFECSRIARGQA
jgi:hypothetical protein